MNVLRSKANSSRLNREVSATDYYRSLNLLWDELDKFESLEMKSSADSAAFAEFIERERLFRFLWGLNSQYDRVKVQIVSKEKLPPITEVFYIVRDEETRRLRDEDTRRMKDYSD